MLRVCEVDQVEFEGRSDAKFCSPKCRKAAARAAGIEPSTGEIIEEKKGQMRVVNAAINLGVAIADHKSKEYNREKNLAAFQKMGLDSVEFITTGIPDFDLLTKIPKGRLTQIEGRFGVGKTTLCLNMIRGLRDKKVLYIDSEASLNPNLLVDLEIEAANFDLYNKSAYWEDIAPMLREAIKSAKYDLIVLDSVAMTTTKTIAESDTTAANIGAKAKVINKLLELIMGDLRDTKTALVFINQTRDKVGTYYPETYTPGGSGILYNASLMIALKTIKSWRFPKNPKDNIYFGHEIEATITKSKVNIPHRTGRFKLYYPNPIEIEGGDDIKTGDLTPMETK